MMWLVQLHRGHIYTTAELQNGHKWSTAAVPGESDGSTWVLPSTHLQLLTH